MAEKNEIVEQPKQLFSTALAERLDGVSEALPKEFNKTRFVQNAVALLNDNDVLAEYARSYGSTPIIAGMLKGAYLNLDFMSNEAYLIPYGKKLQFMPSYRGCVKLAQKYSIRPIRDIYAKVVRHGDEFKEKIINGQPTIDFLPLPFNDDEIIGAFAICEFMDGGLQYDVMSRKALDQTRNASKMKNGMAWKFEEEMFKKVVLRRLCKHIQIDFDTPEQYTYFNEEAQIDTKERVKKSASLNSVLLEDSESEVVDAE